MASLRRWFAFSRWARAGLGLMVLATLVAACSLLLDRDKDQCVTDQDCASFGVHPVCRAGVCEASGLGPEGCYFGDPKDTGDFLNRCSTSSYETFDNCMRVGLCTSGAQPAPAVPPPDAAPAPVVDASAVDAVPLQLVDCVDGTRPVVVVGGSTAVQPFLSVVAPLLAPTQIVYQPSGSCNGVDGLFSPDPNKHVIKDIANRPALLFGTDGSSQPCTFGAGAALDVAVSDVFASSCTASYAITDQLSEYLGPIQPMTFVVHSGSPEKALSAEMAHVIFGRGNTDVATAPFRDPEMYPYTDPTLYFVRNASSGTQQMIARAIDVDARRWWGIDRGGSSTVVTQLELVKSDRIRSAIGILSTDFADKERGVLRIVAFQAKQQLRAYYPDSTANTRDKINVRDGHYAIWGPIHFFAQVNNNIPNAAAGALVLRFTSPRLEKPLLDAVIKSGLVPPCAMKVQRKTEMGPIEAFKPSYQCGCYFEATLDGKPPDRCKACVTSTDCTTEQVCNEGFCEAKP